MPDLIYHRIYKIRRLSITERLHAHRQRSCYSCSAAARSWRKPEAFGLALEVHARCKPLARHILRLSEPLVVDAGDGEGEVRASKRLSWGAAATRREKRQRTIAVPCQCAQLETNGT
jgi:hypothetical protein